ncbi:MAG: undecaprenyldiphospho-muramoylpentapeptide beta-N-acetylglucosaminyltransferase [Verrucomicrobiota bacterium]|jgi:UDP-N-acetylglucosamine--N-acetylmuramyl-(pentapeptide) pyrophosphoryl-undecaprenol N-acetylglucosamine transferase
MIAPGVKSPFVAIACGGTGGHLFPGLAVAEQLQRRDCAVTLLISPKDIDRQAVKSARDMEVVTLPAVALQNRNYISFARSFWQSWRASQKIFKDRPPQAVLAMGGFTSAPPVLAAKKFHAKTFLHESNAIPGRANRFLARFVDEAFVGFPAAAARLRVRKVTTTGTPVRLQFQPRDPAACRTALGFEPDRPVILVMGGSQGASGINGMILSALPVLGERAKNWQWLHLTGVNDSEKVKSAYDARGLIAVVKPFLTEMDLALGAATVAVSRAGASSLAEIAAMRLPSLLIPYPTAANNHQFHNARAFEKTGAARLLEQKATTPGKVAVLLRELVEDTTARSKIQTALAQWHAPRSAEQIAEIMLAAIFRSADSRVRADESLREIRGQGCPRSDAVERQNFSAA